MNGLLRFEKESQLILYNKGQRGSFKRSRSQETLASDCFTSQKQCVLSSKKEDVVVGQNSIFVDKEKQRTDHLSLAVDPVQQSRTLLDQPTMRHEETNSTTGGAARISTGSDDLSGRKG